MKSVEDILQSGIEGLDMLFIECYTEQADMLMLMCLFWIADKKFLHYENNLL